MLGEFFLVYLPKMKLHCLVEWHLYNRWTLTFMRILEKERKHTKKKLEKSQKKQSFDKNKR